MHQSHTYYRDERTTSSMLYNTQQAAPDQSPLPVVVQTIPLPPISSVPVILHPLLRYASTPAIVFNLNGGPIKFALHPYISTGASNQNPIWLNEPAAIPSDICSLTIRIVGIERPVVIVAATNPIAGIITVRDVLCACYQAWREAKAQVTNITLRPSSPQNYAFPSPISTSYLLSSFDDFGRCGGTTTAVNQLNTGAASQSQCYFQHSSKWNGLQASEVEPDVWILRPSLLIKRT